MTLPDPPKRPRGQPRKPETAVKAIRLPLTAWEAIERLPGATMADKLSPLTHARTRKPKFLLYSDGTWEEVKKTQDKA